MNLFEIVLWSMGGVFLVTTFYIFWKNRDIFSY